MLKRILSVLVVACAAPLALAGPRDSQPSVSNIAAADLERAQTIASKGAITPGEVAEIATALGNSQYTVLWEQRGLNHVEFGEGLMRLGEGFGAYFQEGERLGRGVYWNLSSETVWLGRGDGNPEVEIPANGLVVIGSTSVEEAQTAALAAGSCVSCGAGFYACCCRNNGGSSSTCNCIPNGTGHNCTRGTACTSGGLGATDCTLPHTAISVIKIAELLEGGDIEAQP